MMHLVRQKIVAVAGILILAGFLFPPFHTVRAGSIGTQGYSFIFLPPGGGGWVSVDIGMLLTEWVGIILLAGIVWILAGIQEAGKQDAQARADHESLIAKVEAGKLAAAQEYEDGKISLIDFETRRMELDRVIRALAEKRVEAMIRKSQAIENPFKFKRHFFKADKK